MISIVMKASLCCALTLGISTVAANAADSPTSQTFDAAGVKIHYLLAGRGEPVVLIHGLHSSAQINWGAVGVIDELAKDHQVVAVDLPGHGQSDKPGNHDAYGLQLVEDIVLLLDRLKIDKAHLVGYSLGGMVTLKFIAEHPDRVLSGTLGGMGWLREGSALQRVWENMPAREGARTPPEFVRNIGKLAVSEADLKRIRTPIKVIVGERDPVERWYVAPLKRVRNDWPVVEIEEAGHINCIVKPRFRQEIVDWLRQNRA